MPRKSVPPETAAGAAGASDAVLMIKLRRTLDDPDVVPAQARPTREERQHATKALYRSVKRAALLAITPEKLMRAGAKELAITAGICEDKELVLDGQPSQIVGHTHEARGALDRLCEAIVSERERRRALEAETAASNGGTR